MMQLLFDEELLKTPVGSAIVRKLETSIDTTLSPCLQAVGKEVSHSRKNVESRVKRNVKQKLLSRSKRPPTDGWRMNDKELMNSTVFTNSQWKDVVTLWA